MSAIQQQDANNSLSERYARIRQQTVDLCLPLEIEDYQVQPMADASPPKWHLAHVTWFFETFILSRQVPGYEPVHPLYEMLFNSYYNGIGAAFPRPNRGFLSRPTVQEVLDYRSEIDERMQSFLASDFSDEVRFSIELGLNHEQQHQELTLTDLKYNLGNNPLKPAYREILVDMADAAGEAGWTEFEGGLVEIGAESSDFVFDNETPRHQVFLEPFALGTRAVTNGEFLEFIRDGGYERHELWLSDGWSHLKSLDARWSGPLYWRVVGDDIFEYTLTGERPLEPDLPVCHVSGYEADAFARWAGARLPTEMEWETAAESCGLVGNFVESEQFHPSVQASPALTGMLGDVWEWTSSSYAAYPGFKSFPGQLGEYNGKFMANQLVLKGGSCVTPASHIRSTYRNFFYPPDRWQFTGIRLARDPE